MAVKIPKRLRDLNDYKKFSSLGYVVIGPSDGNDMPDAGTQADIDVLLAIGIPATRIAWIELRSE